MSFQRILERLSQWKVAEIFVTLLAYSLYASVLGLAAAPALIAALAAAQSLVVPSMAAGALPPLGSCVLFALSLGGALYVFYLWGLILIGLLMRLLALGVRPGRHAPVSAVTLVWMILNGVFTFAYRMILPMVPMTFFAETFYRLCGCRIGKGARINTFVIIDPYLVEIGERTVIGGDAVLSPHAFEHGHLYIAPIRIGKDCLIGGHAYISPGVTIGDGSTIGLRSYIRKDRRIPPGSRIMSLAGLTAREMYELERRQARSTATSRRAGDPRGPVP